MSGNGNGRPTDVVVTMVGELGNWHPVRVLYDDGQVHVPGCDMVDGRMTIGGHPYHLVGCLGKNRAAQGGEWVILAHYRADGYNVLMTYGYNTEPCLSEPAPLERAIEEARLLVTKNLVSLGTKVMCTVVPQKGRKREFGFPVAVCDAHGVGRAEVFNLHQRGELLPVTMIKEAGEAGTSPAQMTGTAANDDRHAHYTASLPACQAI